MTGVRPDGGEFWPRLKNAGTGTGGTSGGVGGALVPIFDTTLSVAQANVPVTVIPQAYRDLLVVVRGRGDKAATTCTLFMTANSDTSASYDYQRIEANNTTQFNAGFAGQTKIQLGYLPAANAPAGVSSVAEAKIFDYANTVLHKTIISMGGAKAASGAPAAGDLYADVFTGWYRATGAIGRLDIFADTGNLAAGTSITVWGINATLGSAGGSSAGAGLIGQASFSASGGAISSLSIAGIIANVTRVSAGRYTVTFASPQPDTNYAAHIHMSDDSTAAMFAYYQGNATNYTINGFDFYTYAFGPNTPQDRAVVRLTIFRYGGTSVAGTGRIWDVTAIPTDAAVVSAKTTDFATLASLTGFTWANQGTSTAAIQRKRLVITPQVGSTGVVSRRVFFPPFQLPTSGIWCVQAPVTMIGASHFNNAGILVKGATLSRFIFAGLLQRNDTGLAHVLWVGRQTSETAVSSDQNTPGYPKAVIAIAYDGTNIKVWFSPDGQDWAPSPHFTEAAATFIGAGPYTYAFWADTQSAFQNVGAFNNAIVLNQATPIPHGQLI